MKRIFIKNVGFRYTIDNISIIMQVLSMSKEGIKFTDDEMENFAKITLKYLDAVGNKPEVDYLGTKYIPSDFEKLENITFYKYVSKQTLERFIKKGNFQFGSITYYRDTENQNVKDNMEGYCALEVDPINFERHISASVLSGFNFYIFCGTNNIDEKIEMGRKFGGSILKIKNLVGFANAVKKHLGAKRWYYNFVKYSDHKLFQVDYPINDITKVNPGLSDELFKCFYETSFLPSLFVKPLRYSDEQELRLVFEMPKDTKKTIQISNKGLLDFIEIL